MVTTSEVLYGRMGALTAVLPFSKFWGQFSTTKILWPLSTAESDVGVCNS